ncbi:interleukin-1 receptor type 1 isoform X2 [Cottoperca gobio]|uniref:Interleukin-1 receptor type 1 isoform X2 n=1 Tax=Cottoperca gobio TaxID=56716 RepID=A0A6J2RZG2_COTGO|nr:interleukin-1 receptor type 1-like isoform X2 [Cottoperca gobio]
MTAAGCVFLLTALLSLKTTVAHSHSVDKDTYHVSAGHLFLLRCPTADPTWSRRGGHNKSLPTGVEVIHGLLWFLPVQMSHNGSYTCEKRGKNGLSSISFGVSVSGGKCPDQPETISIVKGSNGGVPCKQAEIFKLNKTRNIQWMKDCQPVERPISVDDDGFMRLQSAASERDAGTYTCLVELSLDGRKYTAARSIQVTIKSTRVELKCSAYIGLSEEKDTFIFWTVNGTETDDLEEFDEFTHYDSDDKGQVFGHSTLTISKVSRRFMNVPISCHIWNSAGCKVQLSWLKEADHSAFYTSLALCLSASLAALSAVTAFLFFKVDLVLAHRKLWRHFSKQQVSDGKLYDAYVSFLHPDTLTSDEMENFALQILPEELEKHRYSLYIRGRDDCPGEAVHDVIAATVRQSRRLIMILSPEIKFSTGCKTEEAPLRDNQNQLCYEHKIGLHDALTHNEPRVILVEIDGPVDYRCLPESLRFIKRKQGALKWRKPSPGSHKLTKLHSNRNFWKNLRYHMPSVPAGKLQTII